MAAEATLQNKCLAWLKYLRAQGHKIKWLKIHGSQYQRAGTPDLLIVINGYAIWIELKKPGEEPTKLQDQELKDWRAAGCEATWCDNFEKFKEIVAGCLEKFAEK